MITSESPNVPFTIIRTRFPEGLYSIPRVHNVLQDMLLLESFMSNICSFLIFFQRQRPLCTIMGAIFMHMLSTEIQYTSKIRHF